MGYLTWTFPNFVSKSPQSLKFSILPPWSCLKLHKSMGLMSLMIIIKRRKEWKGDVIQHNTTREWKPGRMTRQTWQVPVSKSGSYGTASPISKPGQSSISANRAISKLDLAIWQAPILKPELLYGPLGGSAPRLWFLRLNSIEFPGLPNLLSSAAHLVHLPSGKPKPT